MEDNNHSDYDSFSEQYKQLLNKGAEKALNAPKDIKKRYDSVRNGQEKLNKLTSKLNNPSKEVAKQTTKQTVKASKGVAKTTQKTARSVSKTAKTSAKTAKTIAKVGAKVAKVAAKVGKAITEGVVKLVKTLASMGPVGWVVLVVLIILLIFLIFYVAIFYEAEGQGATGNYAGSGGDYSNSVDHTVELKDGQREDFVTNMTPQNAAIYNYYNILADESVWQLQDDGSLIRSTDANAVKDYYDRDDKLKLNGDFLYCLNDNVFGKDLVYPEQFLKPVAFDEATLEVKDLYSDDELTVTSNVINTKDGLPTGETRSSVSDYGLASVVKYKVAQKVITVEGNYIAQDVLNPETGEVEKDTTYNAPFNVVVSSENIDLIDKLVCFAGNIQYTYKDTHTVSGTLAEGESTDEADRVTKYIYEQGTVDIYSVDLYEYKNADSSTSETTTEATTESTSGTTSSDDSSDNVSTVVDTKKIYRASCVAKVQSGELNQIVTGTKEALLKYSVNGGYTISLKETKPYTLCRYRDDSSAEYTQIPMPETVKEEDKSSVGTEYLADYLEHFDCYIPTGVSRTYSSLRDISEVAQAGSYYSSSSEGSVGSANGQAIYDNYKDIIDEMSEKYGLSPYFITAIIGVESGGDSNAYNSSSGATGLMQALSSHLNKGYFSLNPLSGNETINANPTQLFDAKLNIEIGSSILRYFLMTNDFDFINGIKGYNGASKKDTASWLPTYMTGPAKFDSWYCGGEYDLWIIDDSGPTQIKRYFDLSGNVIKEEDTGIPSKSGTSGTSTSSDADGKYVRGLSDKDKEIFTAFVDKFDNIYDGETSFQPYTYKAKKDIVSDVIIDTSNFMNHTYYDEVVVNEVDMWDDGFINTLTKKRTTLTGDYEIIPGQIDVIYYNQTDEPWGSQVYGATTTYSKAGCGPTSMAICLSTFTDTIINPMEVGDYIYENGWRPASGTDKAFVIPTATHYGLTCEELPNDTAALVDALNQGKLVMCLMGPGTFTSAGHYVVFTGITEDGKVTCADCGSRNRTQQTFAPELITSEVKAEVSMWAFTDSRTK